MWLLDLLTRFDDALDWQVEDSLLDEPTPADAAHDSWPALGTAAA